MTHTTEPTIDDLEQEITNIFITIDNYGTDEEARVDIRKLISDQVAKARIDEIHAWFDMPKHYPGEEYLDEPFAKAKCKTPKKITYYTLDSSFTYSLKDRLEPTTEELIKEWHAREWRERFENGD